MQHGRKMLTWFATSCCGILASRGYTISEASNAKWYNILLGCTYNTAQQVLFFFCYWQELNPGSAVIS
jgi:hypothetical protein